MWRDNHQATAKYTGSAHVRLNTAVPRSKALDLNHKLSTGVLQALSAQYSISNSSSLHGYLPKLLFQNRMFSPAVDSGLKSMLRIVVFALHIQNRQVMCASR